MGRPKSYIVLPNVSIDDIIKYTKRGGCDGVFRDGTYARNLTEDEQAYCLFLYALDKQLTGDIGNRDYDIRKVLAGKSKEYKEAYLQGRIDEIIRGYAYKYIEPAMQKQKSVVVVKEDRNSWSNYVVQYLLRINGFTINTDVSVRDHSKFSDIGEYIPESEAIRLPIKFLGTFADEAMIKQGVQGKTGTDLHMNKSDSGVRYFLEEEEKRLKKEKNAFGR